MSEVHLCFLIGLPHAHESCMACLFEVTCQWQVSGLLAKLKQTVEVLLSALIQRQLWPLLCVFVCVHAHPAPGPCHLTLT